MTAPSPSTPLADLHDGRRWTFPPAEIAAALGVAVPTLNRWLRGESKPSVVQRIQLDTLSAQATAWWGKQMPFLVAFVLHEGKEAALPQHLIGGGNAWFTSVRCYPWGTGPGALVWELSTAATHDWWLSVLPRGPYEIISDEHVGADLNFPARGLYLLSPRALTFSLEERHYCFKTRRRGEPKTLVELAGEGKL